MEVIFPLTFFFDDIKSSGTLIRKNLNYLISGQR